MPAASIWMTALSCLSPWKAPQPQWPVLMGSVVRRSHVWGALGGALAGSLVFYLSTNLAHWWLTTDYPHTTSGLVECYVAALPFYRWTPVGDLVWSLGLTSGAGLVCQPASSCAASCAAGFFVSAPCSAVRSWSIRQHFQRCCQRWRRRWRWWRP